MAKTIFFAIAISGESVIVLNVKNKHTAYFKNRWKAKKKIGNYKKIIGHVAAEALPEERVAFIRQTYLHLAVLIAAFVILEAFLLSTGIAQNIYYSIHGLWSFLLVLIILLFPILVARGLVKSENLKTQYYGLGLSLLTQAVIFAPVLFMIQTKVGSGIIADAGIVTSGLFLGITTVVFVSHADFSFLKPILIVSAFLLLGFITAGMIFGFWLRSFFAFAMIAFAVSWILLNTSAILHRYRTDQYVAASLTLFFSLLTLFWAILRAYSYSSKMMNRNEENQK